MRLFILLLGLVLAMPAFAVPAREIWQAEFILADTATPPTPNDSRWHPVRLPHALKQDAVTATGGWFRFRIHTDVVPAEPQAIYVWWLNLNAAFYFNDEFLGDGGRFDEPIARNWNKPFLFVLPLGDWHAGTNEVLIRIKSDPGWGILSPVEIGPLEQLRPDYELRRVLQVDLARGLTLTLLIAASLVLAVWWRRRHDPQYFWFGLACLAWAVFSAYLIVRDPPMPGPWFRSLSHLAMDIWAVCMAMFVQHYLGQRSRRVERMLLAYLALAVALTLSPWIWPGYVYAFDHSLGFIIICALTWQVFQRWRQNQWREHYLLGLALVALVLASLHDLLLSLPPDLLGAKIAHIRLKYHFFSLHFAAPVVLLFLTGHLGRRFADALTQAESFNRELERRVEASAQALTESYQRRTLLERETAAAEERERIYRDLHDDIGAKLLSLAIRAKDSQIADIARSALQDLRDVVSRSAQADAPLSDLLADWRVEIIGRCAAADLRLVWNQPEDLPERNMTAADALNLGRILREALSNILRHAEARAVVLGVHFAHGQYQIALEDDGQGKPRAPGRGMRNMRARAAQLGGVIDWTWGEHGCRVMLEFPATAADSKPAG
ncbi:MAG: 7TM diverse intracellular signaling domain-containing protein [Gallionellaceae bacterium]|nr:7TM diverse intracellular signaling domain-containing protein [Gallionellaceae bacterium]